MKYDNHLLHLLLLLHYQEHQLRLHLRQLLLNNLLDLDRILVMYMFLML
jgi:hypothetical protein